MTSGPALPPPAEDQRWWGLPRPWVEAALYVLAAVVAAAAGLSGLWNVFEILDPRPSVWWGLAIAVPASVLVVTKYRVPRASLALAVALFVVDIATVGGIVPFLIVLDVLRVVVVRADERARRSLVVGGIVLIVLGAAIAYLRTGDVRVMLTIAIQWGGVGGLVYWYATAWRQSRELVALHRQTADDAAEGVRQALRAATRIGYSTGPSGTALVQMIDDWGLTGEVGDRLVQARPGVPVAASLAAGDVDLGFQQLSELVGAPGVRILGVMPGDCAIDTVFSGAVAAAASDAAAARDVLAFFASPDAAAIKAAHSFDAA